MELKEIVKILKNNLKLIAVFAVIGGVVAGAVVVSQSKKYEGNFVIYLNKAAPSKEAVPSYNDFYALQSLSQVADFLVEWTRLFDSGRGEFDLKLKKKTNLFLEGSITTANADEAKKYFDEFVNSATRHILYFNDSIFSESQIYISFADFTVSEIKINFWRYFGAGIFGGLMLGVFAVFMRHYFKS